MDTLSEIERRQREQANANSKLLSLPAELRINIYTSALSIHSRSWTSIRSQEATPAILQSSRQLRDEASEIWYAQQYFVIPEPSSSFTATWLKSLSQQAIMSLLHVSLSVATSQFGRHGITRSDVKKFHWMQINIDRDNEGFQYKIRCVQNPGCRSSQMVDGDCADAGGLHLRIFSLFLGRSRSRRANLSWEEVLVAVSATLQSSRLPDSGQRAIDPWLEVAEA